MRVGDRVVARDAFNRLNSGGSEHSTVKGAFPKAWVRACRGLSMMSSRTSAGLRLLWRLTDDPHMAQAMTVQEQHRAGRAPDEPPYFRSCVLCNQSWPCPDRLAAVRADAAVQQAERISDDARRVGVLALVERGVSVWSSTRRDAFDQPLGGVVVEIEDVLNRETGEFERWFTCLDPYGSDRYPVNVRRLAEAEVKPDGVEATGPGRLTALVKRLGLEVHDRKGSFLDPFAAERVRWMYLLVGLSNLAA